MNATIADSKIFLDQFGVKGYTVVCSEETTKTITTGSAVEIPRTFVGTRAWDEIGLQSILLIVYKPQTILPVNSTTSAYPVWYEETDINFLRKIRTYLVGGDYITARRSLGDATRDFPLNSKIKKYDKILAEPKVIRKIKKNRYDIRKNDNWLVHNRQKYLHEWVALRNGSLLGHNKALKELVKEYGVSEEILYTKVF